MTNVALSPTNLTADDSLYNVTTSVTGNNLNGNTTCTIPWAPNTVIILVNGATGAQVQVTIASTVLGQAVTNYTALTVAASSTYILGPFHSVLAGGTTGTITLNLTTPTTLSAQAVNIPGVY